MFARPSGLVMSEFHEVVRSVAHTMKLVYINHSTHSKYARIHTPPPALCLMLCLMCSFCRVSALSCVARASSVGVVEDFTHHLWMCVDIAIKNVCLRPCGVCGAHQLVLICPMAERRGRCGHAGCRNLISARRGLATSSAASVHVADLFGALAHARATAPTV